MALLDSRHKDIRNLPGVGLTAALAVAFLYAPILFLALNSFNAGRSISRLDGLSLRWYRAVFANEEIARAALNSVVLPCWRPASPLSWRRRRRWRWCGCRSAARRWPIRC